MDEIISAISALLVWRFVISTLGAIVLAALLSHLFSPFTAEFCITLVILGATIGIYWQGRSESSLSLMEKVEEPEISPPVAFIGLAFIGLVVGGLLGELFDSKLGGVFALILSAGGVALWFRVFKQRPISRRSFGFSIAALLFGYSVLLTLSFWNSV